MGHSRHGCLDRVQGGGKRASNIALGAVAEGGPRDHGNPFFFENTQLARALSLAINRDEIAAVAYGAGGAPTCNVWPVEGPALSTNNDWCKTQDIEAAKALLDANPSPTEEEIRFWLAGNLCRCTGYDKIVRAVADAAAEMRGEAS